MNYLYRLFSQERFRHFLHRQTLPSPAPMEQVQQSAPADPPDPLPGRDMMFTLIRENLTMQIQAGDQLDTKASGILVGGTTLVGFAFLVQHHPAGNCSSLIPIWMHHWPISMRLAIPYLPFLLSYVFTMIFAVLAFRIQTYWNVPDPVTALKRMNEPEKVLKESISQATAHFAKFNQTIVEWKARRIEWALYLLLAEIAFLVLLLVYQTVC